MIDRSLYLYCVFVFVSYRIVFVFVFVFVLMKDITVYIYYSIYILQYIYILYIFILKRIEYFRLFVPFTFIFEFTTVLLLCCVNKNNRSQVKPTRICICIFCIYNNFSLKKKVCSRPDQNKESKTTTTTTNNNKQQQETKQNKTTKTTTSFFYIFYLIEREGCTSREDSRFDSRFKI
jgi:hypothetical protein